MKETGKTTLRAVENDWDQIENKIKEHRKKRMLRILLVVVICVAVVVGLFLFCSYKTYQQIAVEGVKNRNESQVTKYISCGEQMIRYSNDGATCLEIDNSSLWAVSFEMQSPIANVADTYTAFADQGGKNVVVVDPEGKTNAFTTDLKISQITVSNKGTVAVLMQNGDTGYLCVYDGAGNKTAEGAIHADGSGYPMSIELSPSGETLAVTTLSIQSGQTTTNVQFYNFGDVGEEQADRIIANYDYVGTVIPSVHFMGNDKMIAFGDNQIIVFDCKKVPKEATKITLDKEAKSVFYNERYMGVLSAQGEETAGNSLDIYNYDGTVKNSIALDHAYDEAYFMANGEIFVKGTQEAAIYTTKGLGKFTGKVKSDVELACSGKFYGRYVFVYEDEIDSVRLALMKQ